MARKKDATPSTKVRFEGSRKRGVSRRDDKTFEWLDGIPKGSRFAVAWELITAALNGELGPAVQQAVEESDSDKAREAAAQIWASFVVDEDDQ